MTLAAITITVLAFVVIAQRIRIYCLRDALAHRDRHCNELSAICHDAYDSRDAYAQRLAHLNERVGAYLREATMLVAENERLKRGDGMDSDAIIEDVARWLEARP
jgi:hypothetical protein